MRYPARIHWFAIAALCLACVTEATATEALHVDQNEGKLLKLLSMLQRQKSVPAIPMRDLFLEKSRSTVEKNEEKESATAVKAVKKEPLVTITAPPQLLAILIQTRRRVALFSEGDRLITVEQGGLLDKRYRVSRIYPQKIEIKDVATGLLRTIYAKD